MSVCSRYVVASSFASELRYVPSFCTDSISRLACPVVSDLPSVAMSGGRMVPPVMRFFFILVELWPLAVPTFAAVFFPVSSTSVCFRRLALVSASTPSVTLAFLLLVSACSDVLCSAVVMGIVVSLSITFAMYKAHALVVFLVKQVCV